MFQRDIAKNLQNADVVLECEDVGTNKIWRCEPLSLFCNWSRLLRLPKFVKLWWKRLEFGEGVVDGYTQTGVKMWREKQKTGEGIFYV